MTDYLEELLEEITAEERPSDVAWDGVSHINSAALRAGGRPEMQQASKSVSAQEQTQTAAWAAARLSGAVSRLDRAAQHSVQNTPFVPADRARAAEERSVAALSVSAAQVDAAFQRDSRRYDGALSLL